ncbi:MAG: 4-hydroxybenzoate octaprenyltransferase, partial [Pseudomonadota bacterium]
LAAGAVWAAGGGLVGYVGAFGLTLHMASQIRRLDIADPARCLLLFRETRFGGMALAGALFFDSLL